MLEEARFNALLPRAVSSRCSTSNLWSIGIKLAHDCFDPALFGALEKKKKTEIVALYFDRLGDHQGEKSGEMSWAVCTACKTP